MPVKTLRPVHYPESDGKPLAETDIHIRWFVTLRGRLKRWYAGKKVYVGGNLLIYYVEGKPAKSFAPDAFVVKKCEPRERRIFKIWQEGRVPNWAMEITSASTRKEDLRIKMPLYASLGIKEYFLYDPLGEWLDPSLIGYQLVRGHYESIIPQADGTILSKELGILFGLDGSELVMKNPATGELVLSNEELTQLAEQRAEVAELRLVQMAAELERMRQEIGRKPNGKPKA